MFGEIKLLELYILMIVLLTAAEIFLECNFF